jgi:hypothetical protein
VMEVESSGYHERYVRFALTDIKAVFIEPSSRRTWWGIWWGVWLVIFVIKVIWGLVSGDGAIGSLLMAVLFAIPFTWNLVLGPTCRVWLVTRVQTVALGSLVRTNKAKQILETLRPQIAAAQAQPTSPESQASPTSVEPAQ